MKLTSLFILSLVISLSAQAETQVPVASTMPQKMELSDLAKVNTKTTFNDAVISSENNKSQNQAQDMDSGLQLSDSGVDANRKLEVVGGGVKLPSNTLIEPAKE